MQPLLDSSRRWYRISVRGMSYLGDVLLLLVRVYWGSLLVESGWNKFTNLTQTATYFEHLGIFWPKFNAILSGGAELGCGALLVIGLAARTVAVAVPFGHQYGRGIPRQQPRCGPPSIFQRE